jgi:type IV pilus assembly protein PilN
MKDLNFFDSYIEKKEFKFEKIYILYFMLFIVVVITIFSAINNQLKINELSKLVDQKREVAEDSKILQRVDKIKELEDKVNIFKEEVNSIIELDKSIKAKDVIGDKLLINIRSKMPDDLFLKSFSAYEGDIQLTGSAKDTYSIAEFAKGLQLIEDTDNVFVSSITNSGKDFGFVINFTLKDVNEDGPENIQEK